MEVARTAVELEERLGQLLRELSAFLKPITAARQTALHEMTDFLNRW